MSERTTDKTYTLIDDGGSYYTDQDGVSSETPNSWLWTEILGGCGCGTSDELAEEAFKLLSHFATPMDQRGDTLCHDKFYELMAHWFDSKELIEHGSSVMYPWLTEKGEQIHRAIKRIEEAKEDDNG